MNRPGVRLVAAAVCLGVLAACSPGQGEPDRTETFEAAGSQCTAQWWLDPLVDAVPPEASSAASRALEDAKVSSADIEVWEEMLLDSQSGDQDLPPDELEGYAYIEEVRLKVREGLDEAGYPDAPTRIIEVRSDLECS